MSDIISGPPEWLFNASWFDITAQARASDAIDQMLENALEIPVTGRLNDAVILGGGWPAEALSAPIRLAYVYDGLKKKNQAWGRLPNCENGSDLLDALSTSAESKQKDGRAILQGEVVESIRLAESMSVMHVMLLDFDYGLHPLKLMKTLLNLGACAIVWFTYSHGQTQRLIAERALLGHAGCELPAITVAHAIAYLSEQKGYPPEVLKGAQLKGRQQFKGGMMFVVEHQPMPKMRVLIPLEKPYDLAESGLTHEEAMRCWTERQRGFATQVLQLPIDEACLDISHAHYMPAHPPGKDPDLIVILPGQPIDFDSLPRLSKPRVTAGQSSATRKSKPVTERNPPRSKRGATGGPASGDSALKRFAAKHGKLFSVTEYLRSSAEIRDDKGDKVELRCPNDDAHSNPGDPNDRACFAIDGDGESGFQWACQHGHCKGQLDRLDLLKLHMEQVGHTIDDLMAFVQEIEEEPAQDDSPSDGAREGKDAATSTSSKLKLPPPYRVEGGFIGKDKKINDNQFEFEAVCTEFEVVALGASERDDNYSVILKLKPVLGEWKEIIIPWGAIHSDPRQVRKQFASQGGVLYPARAKEFDNLIAGLLPKEKVVLASLPGWHADGFLTPGGEFCGESGQRFRLEKPLTECKRGSLAGQLRVFESVFKAAAEETGGGLDHLVLGVCAGLAGTVSSRAGLGTPILSLAGGTTKGKSTAGALAASCWANPKPANTGLVLSGNATKNAHEARAETSNGTCLVIDDLKLVVNGDVEQLLYLLSSGQGRARVDRDARPRDTRTWTTSVVIGTERSVFDVIQSAGAKANSGASVRCLELNVDHAPKGHPVFALTQQKDQHYGHVGPIVATWMAQNTTRESVNADVSAKLDALCKQDCDPAHRRVAGVLAVLWTSGEYMQAARAAPNEVDLAPIFGRCWAAYQASEVARNLDPVATAVDTLITAIASRRGSTFTMRWVARRHIVKRSAGTRGPASSMYITFARTRSFSWPEAASGCRRSSPR